MSAPTPRRSQRARLSAPVQALLDALVRRHGDNGAAARLGVTRHAVTALADGGHARWDSVARVEAAVLAHARAASTRPMGEQAEAMAAEAKRRAS